MTTKRDAAWQTREAQGEATPPAPQFCCSGAIHADTAHRTQPHRPALCPPLPCSLAPRGAGPTPRGHPTFPHPPCENSPFRCPMNRWPSASTVPETTWVTTGASHPGGDISANARTTRPPAEKVVPGGTPRSPSNSSPTWGAAEAGTRGPETQICAPLPGPTPASQHGRLRKRAPWVLGGAQGAGRGCGVRGGAEVQVSPPDGQPTAARTTLLAIATGVSCMRLHSGWDASSPALETSSSGAVTAMEQRRRSPNEIQPAGCCGPSQAPGRLPFVRQRGGKDLVPTLPSSLLLSQARPPSWGPVT